MEKTITEWDRHEPHYALFLAFLRLFEFARTEMNTITGRHWILLPGNPSAQEKSRRTRSCASAGRTGETG
ncbi:MAG: hypothetical protein U0586_14810 [Candidatus Brocadiaceae bacterium]